MPRGHLVIEGYPAAGRCFWKGGTAQASSWSEQRTAAVCSSSPRMVWVREVGALAMYRKYLLSLWTGYCPSPNCAICSLGVVLGQRKSSDSADSPGASSNACSSRTPSPPLGLKHLILSCKPRAPIQPTSSIFSHCLSGGWKGLASSFLVGDLPSQKPSPPQTPPARSETHPHTSSPATPNS